MTQSPDQQQWLQKYQSIQSDLQQLQKDSTNAEVSAQLSNVIQQMDQIQQTLSSQEG